MRSLVLSLLLLLGPAMGVWGQEDAADADDPVETEVEADVDDEPELDDESYIDADDDDFRPSEDIPADQSIAFPADI